MMIVLRGCLLAFASLLACGCDVSVDDEGSRPANDPFSGIDPERIVSLAPSLTEIVLHCGEGDRLVGVTTYCADVPEDVTRVGDLHADVESVVACRPTVVIAMRNTSQQPLFRALRQLGIDVAEVPNETVDDVVVALGSFARVVGAEARARSFENELENELRAPSSQREEETRLVVAFVVSRRPVYAAGSGSFIDRMLDAAGARNALADVDASWTPIEIEELSVRDPDVIVDSSIGVGESPVEVWAEYAPALRAVREGRVHRFAPVTPGVRIPEWIRELREICTP